MIKNKPIIPILIGFITIFLLVLAVKGDRGNPIYFQSELDGRLGGPFESTGSNSRFVLTWAIVEQRTIFFDIGLARFAAPDLVKYHGKYFSAFLPGVSFLGVPFYWLGKLIGLPQLITYSLTMVLALINAALVAKIARKFGVDTLTSWLSGLIFLFATNALAYALTFTQHQASLTLILLAVINAMGGRTLWKNVGLGLILGMGLLIDIPNVIILSPLVMYVLMKHLDIMHVGERVKLSLQFIGFGIVIGILPLVLLEAVHLIFQLFFLLPAAVCSIYLPASSSLSPCEPPTGITWVVFPTLLNFPTLLLFASSAVISNPCNVPLSFLNETFNLIVSPDE